MALGGRSDPDAVGCDVGRRHGGARACRAVGSRSSRALRRRLDADHGGSRRSSGFRPANRLVADDLVASLLLVHGLHPHDLRRRVADALDRVRPYLGSHGGDVHLLDIVGDAVQLQFAGSCKSCPSSAVTLELAVEDAIRAAAPEVSSIEVVTPEAAPAELLR